jgi:hypothetical protein
MNQRQLPVLFRRLVPVVVALWAIAIAAAAAAQPPVEAARTAADSNVRFAGQVGGGSDAIYVLGSRAYVGEGPSLVILDIGNPTQPTVLGKTTALAGFVTAVKVVGTRAYVADSFGSLHIFDVSNPAQTSKVGFVDTPGSSDGVDVSGTLVFLANYDAGLRIVDISNPVTPREVGFFDTAGLAYDVAVAGNFAYVADGSNGLRVIDVANPAAPVEAGFYDTPDDARGLDVADNMAYVADGDSGLQIIDVSTPAAPVRRGFVDTPFYGLDVSVAGTMAYVADGGAGLRIVNVSNPAAPVEAGFRAWDEYAYSVFATGTTVYVGHSGPGVRIIDASQPANPAEVAYYQRPAGPLGVFVAGNLAYLADGSHGLRIVDLTNLASAREIGRIDTPYHADKVFVAGTTAYVADLSGGLRIINVANPAAPTEIGFYTSANTPIHGVFAANNIAYVTENLGLRLLNIANPANPTSVGFISTVGVAEQVQVVGTRAYVAAGGGGLRIINVSNPASPSQLGFYDTPGYAHDVHVVGSLAYVADGSSGIAIIDVSNPATPQLRGTLDTLGSAMGIRIANNVAYVADYTNDVRVINVANPSAPQEVGFYEMPGNAWGVFAVDNTFYVANNPAGLFVLRYPACYVLSVTYTGSGALPSTSPALSSGCQQPGQYTPGQLVTLSASPAANWRVGGWVGTNNDNTTSKVNQVSMPEIDHDVTVSYAPICYLLSVGHTGEGSNPGAMPGASSGCPPGQYVAGETIALVAQPATGFTVGSWSGTADNARTAADNTVAMPGQNHTVGVNYVLACYPLTLAHTGSGDDPMASPPQSGGCPAGQYHFNEVINLAVVPAQGWQVTSWSGSDDNGNTQATNKVTMPPQNHTVSANYGEIPVVGIGDSQEMDDTCTRHRPIAANGSETQERTFHVAGDVDWVRFTAVAGVTYRVDIQIPDGSPADVNLEVYARCEDAPIGEWHESFSPGARLDVPAPASGQVYLRISNQAATVAGNDVRYQLSVRALDTSTGNRALILVAGRLKGTDSLQRNIHNVTNSVYTLFQRNGYTDDNIYYLATDATLPGYDAALTKESLRVAVTQWAKGKVGSNGVLTLYLMDHGSPNLFYLDNLNGQLLTPDDLDGWLSELEAAIPGIRINVIVEACQSGSFIVGPGSISKAGRVVITSSDAVNDAKASKDGAYFSDHLLTWLHQGYNLLVAFDEAREVAGTVFTLQQALLDANGNGIPNELADASAAAQRSFAYAGTLSSDDWPPHIFSATAPATLADFSGIVEADVRDNVGVRQVWGVVYPPDYVPPAVGTELQPEVLPTFLLTPVDGGNRYAGTYTGFTQAGTYRILVHAEDGEGLKAKPVVVTVKAGASLYLPAIRR